MRHAKSNDYWKNVYKRNYDFQLKNINLNGLKGLNTIDINKGIFVICGLNGVGKSTIISVLKSILGIELNSKDCYRIDNNIYTATIANESSDILFKNTDDNKLNTTNNENISLLYLDYEQSLDIINYLEQENLEEYTSQFSDYDIDPDSLEDISYIIGREYNSCTIIEIEDDNKIIPYFKVTSNNIEYDSLNMGLGEHVLFYFFWAISRLEHKGILVIEEPENFISIKSQENLMDYIAKKVSLIGFNVFITTHSPYIIKKIPHNNIKIINRFRDNVSIVAGNEINALAKLGLDIRNKGIIYVEDEMAKLFFESLLRKTSLSILTNYSLEAVGGESEISIRLKFPHSPEFQYRIIGIYDGDMKTTLTAKTINSLNWNYFFLPGTTPVEEEFRQTINANIIRFISAMDLDESTIINALEATDGQNYHDWFINMAKLLTVGKDYLFNIMFNLWYENNTTEVNEFISQLKLLNS